MCNNEFRHWHNQASALQPHKALFWKTFFHNEGWTKLKTDHSNFQHVITSHWIQDFLTLPIHPIPDWHKNKHNGTLWRMQKYSYSYWSLYLRTLLKSDLPISDNHKIYNIHITVFALTPSSSLLHLVFISKESLPLTIFMISLNPFTTCMKYKHGRAFFLLCTSLMYWYVTDFTT